MTSGDRYCRVWIYVENWWCFQHAFPKSAILLLKVILAYLPIYLYLSFINIKQIIKIYQWLMLCILIVCNSHLLLLGVLVIALRYLFLFLSFYFLFQVFSLIFSQIWVFQLLLYIINNLRFCSLTEVFLF